MIDSPPQHIGISEAELRLYFESGQFIERTERGELVVVVLPNASHPASADAGQVPGTLSQMISYREPDCNNEVARAHRYLKPDGTLGGSGKPDPKLVLQGGILYGQRRRRQGQN